MGPCLLELGADVVQLRARLHELREALRGPGAALLELRLALRGLGMALLELRSQARELSVLFGFGIGGARAQTIQRRGVRFGCLPA